MNNNRLTYRIIIALILLYLILLWPSGLPELASDPKMKPFVWNQDEYWNQLQQSFESIKQTECDLHRLIIESKLNSLNSIVDSINSTELPYNDPVYDSLEIKMFDLTPYMAACPDQSESFTNFYIKMRNVVKKNSINWNMKKKTVRHRLYRLLYGGRAAIEEILLINHDSQLDYDPLMLANSTYSATPQAEFMGVSIHSGDILISRGGAPTSALIARGSDYPGNFSHVALVHVDSAGLISIIESHIEIGVAVASIDQYLKDKKLRVMVLRLREDHPALINDPILPHKSATFMLTRAKSEHIPYDFEMDYNDNAKLFCSEVASAAYEKFEVTLWAGISTISSVGLKSWLAAFGVTHFETQEPSDLEYDPQLNVVAEWRDPETLYKDHIDNAILDAMLEKAEEGDRLEYDWYLLPIGRVMKFCSWLLNLSERVGPIPEGMSAASALRNERFSKKHRQVKDLLIIKCQTFADKNNYQPPYWEIVKLAREALKETE